MERQKDKGTAQVRADEIPEERQPFRDRFGWYLQKYMERNPKGKHSDIYKAAGLSKQRFSKIINNTNADFRPKKSTVILLAQGLGLTRKESEDLLHCAGYTLPPDGGES
ncbi:MAG: hypothetical protein K6G18_10085 [Treponema sp.]|nr:hypothetical protein [Treponema sp.]